MSRPCPRARPCPADTLGLGLLPLSIHTSCFPAPHSGPLPHLGWKSSPLFPRVLGNVLCAFREDFGAKSLPPLPWVPGLFYTGGNEAWPQGTGRSPRGLEHQSCDQPLLLGPPETHRMCQLALWVSLCSHSPLPSSNLSPSVPLSPTPTTARLPLPQEMTSLHLHLANSLSGGNSLDFPPGPGCRLICLTTHPPASLPASGDTSAPLVDQSQLFTWSPGSSLPRSRTSRLLAFMASSPALLGASLSLLLPLLTVYKPNWEFLFCLVLF